MVCIPLLRHAGRVWNECTAEFELFAKSELRIQRSRSYTSKTEALTTHFMHSKFNTANEALHHPIKDAARTSAKPYTRAKARGSTSEWLCCHSVTVAKMRRCVVYQLSMLAYIRTKGCSSFLALSVIPRHAHAHKQTHTRTHTCIEGVLVHVGPVIQSASQPPPLSTAVQQHALCPVARLRVGGAPCTLQSIQKQHALCPRLQVGGGAPSTLQSIQKQHALCPRLRVGGAPCTLQCIQKQHALCPVARL